MSCFAEKRPRLQGEMSEFLERVQSLLLFFVHHDVSSVIINYLNFPHITGRLVASWKFRLNSDEGIGMNGGIASSSTSVYISDYANNVVKVFDLNGTFRCVFGQNMFHGPLGIAVSETEIFVGDDGDVGNSQIHVLSLDGTHSRTWKTSSDIFRWRGSPASMCISKNELFVASNSSPWVQVYRPADGWLIRQWRGIDMSDYSGFTGITVFDQEVFVVDARYDRIQIFDRDNGSLLRCIKYILGASGISVSVNEVYVGCRSGVCVFKKKSGIMSRKWLSPEGCTFGPMVLLAHKLICCTSKFSGGDAKQVMAFA